MTGGAGGAAVTGGPGPATGALQARWAEAFLPTYGVPPVALVSGRGCRVTDADGREYLDLVAGIAVSSLGHGHPALVAAVAEQVGRLAHTSNLYVNTPSLELAERLRDLSGLPGARVFLCSSGAEATETALKIARRHGHASPGSDGAPRTTVVAAEGSFHGRTTGALAITGNPAKREPFAPLLGPVEFVPWGDADALAAAVGPSVAAVVLEPTLGEGGVVPAPPGYLAAARAACDAAGALLVLDEVQSGVGRTGAWFAFQAEGVRPDVVTLAKGLAGGLPVGAVLAAGDAAGLLRPGDHGSTFGGNPVSAAAALAVLRTVEEEGLLAHVRDVGARLADGLAALDDPLVASTRGSGLWQALVLSAPRAPQVEAAARDAGLLVNAVRPDVVRLAPPLVLSAAEVEETLDALPAVLRAAHGPAATVPA